mmetsp:Transcript_74191/g.172077  ORF Transcript_74191/g.172077 Transcript_74191/m.172077 type:complete len:155 (+) Transcript_74191:349-813(+)
MCLSTASPMICTKMQMPEMKKDQQPITHARFTNWQCFPPRRSKHSARVISRRVRTRQTPNPDTQDPGHGSDDAASLKDYPTREGATKALRQTSAAPAKVQGEAAHGPQVVEDVSVSARAGGRGPTEASTGATKGSKEACPAGPQGRRGCRRARR